MIVCLVLLGLASFATRIRLGHSARGQGSNLARRAAAAMVALGIVCARLLRQRRPARPS
jgi:hypothetical protein